MTDARGLSRLFSIPSAPTFTLDIGERRALLEREAVSSGTLSEYLNIPTSLPNTRHKSLINYVLCRSSNNPHTAIWSSIEKIIFIFLPLSEFYLIFSAKAAKFPINHWRMTATEGWWAKLQRWRTFPFSQTKHFISTQYTNHIILLREGFILKKVKNMMAISIYFIFFFVWVLNDAKMH